MGRNFELKKSNTIEIFHALQKNFYLSRKELETLTNLSWGSVSAICNDLLQKGILVAEKEVSSTGRPPERLSISTEKKLALGIDINSVGLCFNIVNLAGMTIFSEFAAPESRDKEKLLDQLEHKTRSILAEYPKILSINLSMQGTLDRNAGISLYTNFFKDWTNVPLVKFFEDKFSVPTYLYHDPECLLTYHLANDPRLYGKKNGIIIRIDDGIGMALLTNGVLYEPTGNTACELGHTIVVPNGVVCSCGKRGCLEAYGSLRGIKSLCGKDSEFPTEELINALKVQDSKTDDIITQASKYLGLSIANLFTLFNPDFIVLDGNSIARIPNFYEQIQKSVQSFYQEPFHLLRANFRSDAAAIGAAMLTNNKQLENILFEDT